MKSEKKQNGFSVLRRLIPAVAMLAASATMLSTATYAWFTMNKEVQMTGLNMSATASEGIEISLGGVDAADNLADDLSARPSDADTEKGWKSAVVVGNYYSDIGKLMPASSVDGINFFDAKNASDKGKVATEFKAITLADTMATIEKRDVLKSDGENTSNGPKGYYVDIPVHIRTSKLVTETETDGDIYCKLIITSNDKDNKDLYKAVRVAFIPVDPTGTTNIFAVDDEYYGVGAVSSETEKSAVAVITACVSNTDFPAGDGEVSGLKLPYAAQAGEYGHLDFKVRVWLEGESTSCYDDKAGQAWNISLAFSLDKFEAGA
ncbi:MAG: hypothetical protein ACI4J8_00960 [Oscillospiraceae bacterium]